MSNLQGQYKLVPSSIIEEESTRWPSNMAFAVPTRYLNNACRFPPEL